MHVAPLRGHVATREHATAVADGQGTTLRRAGEPTGTPQPKRLTAPIHDQRLQVSVADQKLSDIRRKGFAVEGTDLSCDVVVGGAEHDHCVGARTGAGVQLDSRAPPHQRH